MRVQLIITVITLSACLAEQQLKLNKEIKEECDKEHPNFSWIDYTILVILLLVSSLIGTFYGFFAKKQETCQDFLLGGSNMGTIPMAISLAASFITAIELLGNPAEMYSQGTQFWMTCISFLLVIPITSYLYLPVYMKLRLTSSYEYLNLRFNRYCRLFASVLYIIQMILYSSVAVYAPAIALSRVTGLDPYLAVALVYAVCIFYASQGGMKAVIMTDTFQGAVLLISLFVIVIIGMVNEDGLKSVWDKSERTNRIELLNIDPNPTIRHSFWSVVVGGTFYWATMFCSNQASIQKYLSVESIGQVRTALWVSSFSLILIYTINFLTGMIIYSANEHCDPLKAGYITGLDQLLPFYVMNFLGQYKGVPGLFVAGIFAASLGTVASALNSLAAITCEDILQGLLKINVPARKGATYARYISIFYGIVSFAFIFVVERLGGVLQVALSLNGMVGGITLGMFSLGMFVPWANTKGVLTGAISALALVLWIGLGAQIASFNGQSSLESKEISIELCPCLNETESMNFDHEANGEIEVSAIYRISYLWYSLIGCLVTVLIGSVVSLITGPQKLNSIDSDLFSPPLNFFLKKSTDVKKTSNYNIQGITNYGLELEDEKINKYNSNL